MHYLRTWEVYELKDRRVQVKPRLFGGKDTESHVTCGRIPAGNSVLQRKRDTFNSPRPVSRSTFFARDWRRWGLSLSSSVTSSGWVSIYKKLYSLTLNYTYLAFCMHNTKEPLLLSILVTDPEQTDQVVDEVWGAGQVFSDVLLVGFDAAAVA